MPNQLDDVDKKAMVVEVAVPTHQEDGTLETGLVPIRGSTWSECGGRKMSVIPVIIGTLGAGRADL